MLFIVAATPTKRAAKAKVGFIGLGNMGGPMANNLIEKVWYGMYLHFE